MTSFLADDLKTCLFKPYYAAAKFAKDARRKARRRTLVLQVPDNKADLVKLAAPCGFKGRNGIASWVTFFYLIFGNNSLILLIKILLPAFEVHNLGL